MTLYLLDANVFIEAKNRYYGLDFCPAFWDWLVMKNRAGKVASVKKVADEISFTRHFYKPQPLRPLEEIRADTLALERETEGLLLEIV